MPGARPLIFAVHRFALDDGPGIRTTVFLKGCPLACVWCHNPEAMRPEAAVASHPDRCIQCGACAAACPEQAIVIGPPLQIDRHRCTGCGCCAAICPALALQMLGRPYQPDELLELLLRDRQFYASSGGGVTFSGGEPTLWPDYVGEVLQALKAEGVRTAIQTCGFFDYDRFARQLLPYLDLIMFDLKCIDADRHWAYTGQDNTLILDNFRRLTRDAGERVLPRVPLVPGMTATADNLLAIAAFLAGQGCERCDLLPYNPGWRPKRQAIDLPLPPGLTETPLSQAEEEKLRRLFHERLLQPIETAA